MHASVRATTSTRCRRGCGLVGCVACSYIFRRHLSASAQELAAHQGSPLQSTIMPSVHAKSMGFPDALRTQVQAAAWHGPGRRCRLFYLLNYDPFETPCYSFSIYPLWYINTSPTPILYCLDRCFTWMIGSFMLHQLEFNNFFRTTHICSY